MSEMAMQEPDRNENGSPSVEVVDIHDLTIDPANLRRRDVRAKNALAASLKRFRPARSIVIDQDGIVRAGNGTIEAAAQIGIDQVVVVTPKPGQLVAVKRTDWTPTEAVAYAIADNRGSELASWDDQGLAEQLRSLQSEQFRLDDIGFTDAEVDKLCESLTDAVLVDDPLGEWQGMPDYTSENKEAFRSIIIHFRNADDVQQFARLINQNLTENTKFAWFPKLERDHFGECV